MTNKKITAEEIFEMLKENGVEFTTSYNFNPDSGDFTITEIKITF